MNLSLFGIPSILGGKKRSVKVNSDYPSTNNRLSHRHLSGSENPVSYSKLVWCGVKDLFDIFPSCVIILFISAYKENDSGTDKVHWWFRNRDSGVYLRTYLQYLILVPIGKRVRNEVMRGWNNFYGLKSNSNTH